MTLPRLLRRALAWLVAAPGLGAAEAPLAEIVREDFTFAAAQSGRMLEPIKGKAGYPRTLEKGEFKLIGDKDWTSGFFPGSRWYRTEANAHATLRAAALAPTAGLEPSKNNRRTHDLGFARS